ncbi:MAG: helix-turn-helix domain-containing protein [Candidatus Dormibacteria bacterium]
MRYAAAINTDLDDLEEIPLEAYTVDQAAQALGIGRSRAWVMISHGEIPSIKLGKLRRVPVEALRAWVAAEVARQAAERSEALR